MKPRPFPQSNITMNPPPGMDNCDPLQTFVGHETDGTIVTISHWQMSAEELDEVNRNGGRVWVRVVAAPTPPISVEVFNPFEPQPVSERTIP